MAKIVCYMPTYSPDTEAATENSRPYTRLSEQEIGPRTLTDNGRLKPWIYMDCIDSILNIRPDIKLVVGDGRSSESIRAEMQKHHLENPQYDFMMYPEKMSQWVIFNDILKTYTTSETEYFVYSSSDVIWPMDWIAEAEKEFAKNPNVQILFPCVSRGDPNLPCQVSAGPRDMDSFVPPRQHAARAPVLNAYAMIFRMDFLRTYGGYPTIFRNCFTESFLYLMCQTMGGEMRVLPRGWVFHWGEGDKWVTPGSAYYYTEEKFDFDRIMNDVMMRNAMRMVNVDYLKKTLYK